MSNENDKDSAAETKESPTTHAKKAQITGIALVAVVILGLVANTYSNLVNRDQAKAEREKEEAAQEQKASQRPERTIADFAAEQQQAAQTINSETEQKKESDRRTEILDKIANSGAQSGNEAAASPRLLTMAEVQAEFQVEERKRVLAAMREGLGRADARREAASESARPANQQTPMAQVDERITALTASQQAIAQRQRALAERAQAMGVNLPAALAGQPAFAAERETASPAAPKAAPANPATFGELGVNRVARDPASSGPKPGEKILPTGTIVSAVLDMDMMSDYAGNWIALVLRPVYDVELENILIPAGTKIVGKSVRATGPNEFIQNRMGAVPLWMIRPDGKRIDFRRTSSMDAAGVAALRGSVDHHFLAQFLGIGAYALIGLGPSLSNYGAEPDSSRDAFVREATGKTRDIGRAFAEKYLNVVPTQRVNAGTPVKIFIEDDIFITPWEAIDAAHFVRH